MKNFLLLVNYALTFVTLLPKVHGGLSRPSPSWVVEGKRSPPGSPWPLPRVWAPGVDLVTAGQLNFEFNVENCAPLEFAKKKYNQEFLFGKHGTPDPTKPVLTLVSVNIPEGEENECQKYPQFTTDIRYEAYDLEIVSTYAQTARAVINATTVWGALRGIETFSQLWFATDWDSPERYFYANVTIINDYARFGHRGMLVDTARHYLKVSVLMNILDGMMYNKFNVFHWHVVNDQSFPYASDVFPELAEKGAYTKKSIYTPEIIKNVIEEARLRGIRVLLEFGTPGHTYSLLKSHVELLTPCYGDGKNPGTPGYDKPLDKHADYENLDPSLNATYDFTRKLFTEIVGLSKDNFLHVGMDEVYYPCWRSSPEIKAFMDAHGYTEMNQVEGHYMTRHIDMVQNLGVKPIMWQDPIDEGVAIPKNIIIQIWKTFKCINCNYGWKNYTKEAIDQGYKVLVSAPWYLNLIRYGPTWREYYEVDPVLDLDIRPDQENQVLGGEAAMWGELVDGTNIVPRLFPFSSAIGERLWSPPRTFSVFDAQWRLDEHRCRLLWRGIQAQPIYPGFCGPWEVDDDR